MKYFKALSQGQISDSVILVSFLLSDEYQIAYRDRNRHPGFKRHCSALPSPSLYGGYQEITEAEAMQLDPEIFKPHLVWLDYEAFKPHDRECEERKRRGA